jgi:hypothetical protein
MIGWMVLGFVVVGAAAWLVLHPPFIRTRPLVRFFRRFWFGLTLVPLGLFFVAVWIRVDTYGLTDERMLLAAGGLWAAILAVVYLIGRGDIRLIPALAGAILLLLSIGPWNYANLPIAQQTMRLEALLAQPGKADASFPPDWTPEQLAKAAAIIDYLQYSPDGGPKIAALFTRYGIDFQPGLDTTSSVLAHLGYSLSNPLPPTSMTAQRNALKQQVDVAATPILLGDLTVYAGLVPNFGLVFELAGTRFHVSDGSTVVANIELSPWLAKQSEASMVDPWIDFALGNRKFRYVIDSLSADLGEAGKRTATNLHGTLFASSPMPTP